MSENLHHPTSPPIRGMSTAEDRLLKMIAELASELAILRERLDTVERLAEAAGTFKREQIEHFQPSADAVAERGELRRRAIAKIFGGLRDEAVRAVQE